MTSPRGARHRLFDGGAAPPRLAASDSSVAGECEASWPRTHRRSPDSRETSPSCDSAIPHPRGRGVMGLRFRTWMSQASRDRRGRPPDESVASVSARAAHTAGRTGNDRNPGAQGRAYRHDALDVSAPETQSCRAVRVNLSPRILVRDAASTREAKQTSGTDWVCGWDVRDFLRRNYPRQNRRAGP